MKQFQVRITVANGTRGLFLHCYIVSGARGRVRLLSRIPDSVSCYRASWRCSPSCAVYYIVEGVNTAVKNGQLALTPTALKYLIDALWVWKESPDWKNHHLPPENRAAFDISFYIRKV